MKITQTPLIRLCIIVFAVGILGCTPTPIIPSDLMPGSSKDEVKASLGEPEQIQDFILPEEPFFGPQESLINLVPAGTVIEEWVYEIGDDVTYVWFNGKRGNDREDWVVLTIATYPRDAVF